MRLIHQDPAAGSMRIQIETDDDMWHLYNVVEPGDLVTASTTRREEKAADKLRAERAEKKRMTLGVRVEKIEFSDTDLRLKLLGTIESGPQDIGQHHTLIFELGDNFLLTKQHWRETQIDRIKKAVTDSNKPRIVMVSLDQDEATVAVLRQFGPKEVVTIRSGRSGKQYQDKSDTGDYHGEIISKIGPLMTPETPLVLLGPGFEKELLAEDGKRREPALFSKVYVYHTGQCGMVGVNELIKRGMGADVLRESRVGVEMEAMEKVMTEIGKDGLATYGNNEIAGAAAAGAVEMLLVLDAKLREQDLDGLVRNVEIQKGSVIVVSCQHDGGKELEALGGMAALLRYRV
jgi:protein pelota